MLIMIESIRLRNPSLGHDHLSHFKGRIAISHFKFESSKCETIQMFLLVITKFLFIVNVQHSKIIKYFNKIHNSRIK